MPGESCVRLYINWAQDQVPKSAVEAYREDLNEVYGDAVATSAKEPSVSLLALGKKPDAFERAFLKFRDAIESSTY